MTETIIPNIEVYLNLLPLFGIALLATFLLTPIFGKLAKRIKAVDLPTKQRGRTDKTAAQRIHKRAKPRLGGLAIVIPFIIISLASTDPNPHILGLFAGIGVLTLVGTLDDIFDLSGKIQLPFHLLAALIVVISGVTFSSIQVAGIFIDLNFWEATINIFGFLYNFVFPADLLAVLWIITLINALNWVGGIDALEESVSLIATLTLMFLGVKTGNLAVAGLAATLAGSILGFIPYNFPPSKIFAGTVGDTIMGFSIAVLAIEGGGKIPAALLILIIPLIDMIWVLGGRIKRNNIKNPIDILSISDRTHLHHRLLDLGYTDKQVLFIESTAIAFLSALAFYLTDLSRLLIIAISVALILTIFSIISIQARSRKIKLARLEKEDAERRKKEPEPPEASPESKYAY